MKKTILFPLALLAGILASPGVYAQATAQAVAKATIVTPISISSQGELNFGNIAVSASAGGTVVMDPSTNARTASNGVTLPSQTGTVSAAIFEVSGVPNYMYTLTVPTQIFVISGANQMEINNIMVSPSSGYQLSSSNGKQTIKIAGTLNVNANQADGNYQTSGTGFTVTVQYQ